MATNHLGHFLLANLLVDQLAKGAKPRLVVTASGVHDARTGDPGNQATLGSLRGAELAVYDTVQETVATAAASRSRM